jgi:hypothetical protein
VKLKFLFFTVLFSVVCIAQNTTVSGVVLDKEYNNEPLVFANVMLKGTSIGSSTDDNGKYSLSVSSGNHILVIGFLGYKTVEIPFTIKANENKVINYTLETEGVMLQDVVLTAKINLESVNALLQEQQRSVEIKQSIGAEEISNKGISDVAGAVTKTTGITKQEGSGSIYVRGLGDRYNSTTLNGLPLPSNNPSRKNINLEIFSTDIVEYIGIDKTFNFRNYGDFAGANIDIVSKNYKGKGMFDFGIESGSNSLAASQDNFYLQDGPSKTGFSNIKYPSSPFNGYNFTTKLNNTRATPINTSYFLRAGKSFNIGDNGKLSLFASASYDNNYTYKSGISRGAVTVQGLARRDFLFESFTYGTNTNLNGNVNYKLNNNNAIQFNSMLINSSSQNNNLYNGIIDVYDIAQEGGGFIRRATFDRTTLYINQLLGSHKLSNLLGKKINVKWGLSYNNVKNILPDRLTNTLIPLNGQSDLSISQVADNNDSENNRFFQNLKDNELAANLSLDYEFNKDEEGSAKGKITLGYSGRFKKVDFEAVQFNFDINNAISQPVVDQNDLDGYFNQTSFENGYFTIKTFNGGLKPQTYSGVQNIQAGFAGVEYKFSPKLTAVFGTRAEYIIQNINWFTNLGQGENKFDKLEILPATSIKYELNEKQNLKFAASKTYTLPQIKERAPFQFDQINEVFVGNPDLYSSTDYNVDLKWDFFPNTGELISITGFGKLIQNPINEITFASATNDITWVNTGEKAIAIGGEFEIRKNIFSKDDEKKETLSSGFNASYMYNNQDFDGAKVENETNYSVFFSKTKGKLTGASDLLLNADITYFKEFSEESNLMATLTYNYFSDRIYALGTSEKGDLVDKAIGTLDFILKSKLTKSIGLGFSLKNITNPIVERFQDKQNVTVEKYKKGVNFKLSLAYQF